MVWLNVTAGVRHHGTTAMAKGLQLTLSPLLEMLLANPSTVYFFYGGMKVVPIFHI